MSDGWRRKNGRDICRYVDDRSVVRGGSRHSVSHNGTGGEDMTRDIIDRQKAINAIANTECHISTSEWNELVDAIISLPSAEKRGRWIDKHGQVGTCSECDYRTLLWKYCPNCGARMEESF